MIVECYTADAYCDCKHHPHGTPGAYGDAAVFTGCNKRETDKQRRDAGWIKVQGMDVCPVCKAGTIELRDT